MLLEEELALVVRAKGGDRDAVGSLWDAITPKLYGYLVNHLRDQHLAEDILQDTWIKAIGNIAKFQPQGVRFSAWLFAIARNECRQHWRKKKPEVPLEETEDVPDVSVSPETIGDIVFLQQVIQRLNEDEQEILRLRYIADLNFKEIARVLSISVILARVRVHRALGKARAMVNNH